MEYAHVKTQVDNVSDIPQGAEKYLPAKGFLFVSGGFVSTPRRLTVDISKNLLSYGIGQNKNQTPYEKLSQEKEIILKKHNLEEIVSIANEIWLSNKNFSSNNITADFNVLLILSDSGKVRIINSYGPPVDEVANLYNLLWNLTSENASLK
ncbi:hypothetical protein HYW53_01510 [Candidatus Giovannonibacteria bacterium]|nr:hypothetical protein [Candidatus Giovannonibacteria bacterium]